MRYLLLAFLLSAARVGAVPGPLINGNQINPQSGISIATLTVTGASGLAFTGQATIQTTMTVVGGQFSVGTASFTVSGGAVSATSQPIASLTSNENQSCPSGSICPFYWNASTITTQGMWSASSASDTIRVTSNGYYLTSCQITFSSGTTGTYRELDIYVDGARKATATMQPGAGTSANSNDSIHAQSIFNLKAGDSANCRYSADQTGSHPTIAKCGDVEVCFFSMVKLW